MALRGLECLLVLALTIWAGKMPNARGVTTSAVELVGTILSFLLSLISSSVRADANRKAVDENTDKDGNTIDTGTATHLKEEEVSIGLEFGNIFSSYEEQAAASLAKFPLIQENPEVYQALAVISGVFGAVDLDLDVIRGIYELDKGLIYRPVTF